ncbi:sensor histidine kinase [Actinocatenispora rupis]|uniref:histidine kinase n=1 Tax=Actinocatenispora rupis TaxID=519421 RepID=A0A8J3ITI8_9ACTN|nr:sensor histidine kinase [Actinocatenispora rupis]GID09656.1 two-component sensor histidine kinase [Actinocatenispora rupis]
MSADGVRDGGLFLPGNPTSPRRTAVRMVSLLAWVAISLVSVPAEHRPVTAVLVAVGGTAVVVGGQLLGRRHWWLTVASVCLYAACGLALMALVHSWLGWVPVIFGVFWAIIRLPARWALAFSSALVVAMVVVGWFSFGAPAVVGQLGSCMGMAILAYTMRSARQRAADAERLLESERQAREATARAELLAERQRLAREIHDILAHTLSAQVVQLEGARLLLSRGADTPAVLTRVEQAQRLARDGLEETRRALESLRGRARPLDEALPALAADSGATYASEGAARDLGPEVSLAIVRTVQEALTNARKHAPGASVSVRLRYAADETSVEIADTGAREGGLGLATTGAGYGLAGMRERAELLGGALSAGPYGDGGFRVRLRIPT